MFLPHRKPYARTRMATALPVPGPACRSPKGELLLWEPLPVLTTIDTRDRLAATIGEVKGWLSDRSAHLPRCRADWHLFPLQTAEAAGP